MAMLADKVVAVTGAGRGIGRAIAMLCAAEGANVVVNDYGVSAAGEGADAAPAEDTAAAIKAAGGRAVANVASVADAAGAVSVIDTAIAEFGRIDAVVNNAGFIRDAIFHKMSQQNWDDVIDVHLNGYFYVSRAAAPHFREQGSGAYVHFVSAAGLIGNVGQANYAAAKMGVVGLSTSIALDMQRFGVRSNCIAPWAWTRSIGAMSAETPERGRWLERMKQMTPEKIAPLAAFLCSDRAQAVSGQIFGVRKNEIFLFSRPQMVRSVHNAEGWTPGSIAEMLLPALEPSFQRLRTSADTFVWDPV